MTLPLPPIPHGTDTEKAIVGRLVTDILAAGYTITVWNGGDEPELKDSTDAAAIFAELAACDVDELTVDDAKGYAGWIQLVWGNDFHIISNYSNRLESVIAPAEQLAQDFEGAETTPALPPCFTQQNTEGYSDADLKALNEAFDHIAGSVRMDPDRYDIPLWHHHVAERLLARYDAGERGVNLARSV